MKKNFFLGGLSFKVLLAAAVLALACCVMFSSCKKQEDEVAVRYNNNPQPQPGDTTVVIMNHTYNYGRDFIAIHLTGHDSGGPVDTAIYIPTGGIGFQVSKHDTLPGTQAVVHSSFTTGDPTRVEFDSLGYHFIRTTIPFTDVYNQYTLIGKIWWLDVPYLVVWGDTINLSATFANANITWQNVITASPTTDGTWDYTLATSSYKITCTMGELAREGYKTLKREAGHDTLVSKVLVNSGWYPAEFNNWNLPKKIVVWADVAPVYSESGQGSAVHYETNANCPISVPADSSLIAQNFNVSWKAAQLGSPVTVNTTTDGYFQITNKKKSYSVGATTPSFTRVFGLQYPKVVWTDGTYTFTIDVPEWSDFGESHTLTDATPVTGYERKLATNYMSVKLGSYSGQVPAKTYIKVEASDPTPPDTTPTPPPPHIVYYEVVSRGLTYVDPNTNTSWMTVRPVYSDSTRGQEFDISINLINTMSTPAEGPVIVSDFAVVATNGGTPGTTTQNGSPQINGDFKVYTYNQPYSADINVGQNLTWTGTWQKAIHIPTGIEMPYADYTYAVSSGSFTQELGSETTQNITYVMKLWTQYITGSLNNHTHQYSGTCIVKAPDYIPRESPIEFGAVVDMVFSMAQPDHGQTFVGVKFVEFQYGYGIFVQGNAYYYAKPGCTNSSIPKVPIKPYNSAIKIGGNWYPAKISMTAGGGSWSYIFADDYHITGQNQTNFTFTVMLGDAIANNVGGDDLNNPIPSCQTWSLVGPVGVLEYPHNNQVPYNNATFMTW